MRRPIRYLVLTAAAFGLSGAFLAGGWYLGRLDGLISSYVNNAFVSVEVVSHVTSGQPDGALALLDSTLDAETIVLAELVSSPPWWSRHTEFAECVLKRIQAVRTTHPSLATDPDVSAAIEQALARHYTCKPRAA